MRAKRDGQPIPGTRRTVPAADVEAILRPTKEPKPAPLALTPNQAARKARGEWVGDDLDPPNYEASVVDDPSTIAAVMGLRPDDFDTAPLGSQPEGQPIAQPSIRLKIEPRPERAHSDDAPLPKLTPEAANELRAAYRAHAAKITEIAQSAKQSGDPVREARAAEQVRTSAALGERLKQKLGGKL